jgi:hypothetical protein
MKYTINALQWCIFKTKSFLGFIYVTPRAWNSTMRHLRYISSQMLLSVFGVAGESQRHYSNRRIPSRTESADHHVMWSQPAVFRRYNQKFLYIVLNSFFLILEPSQDLATLHERFTTLQKILPVLVTLTITVCNMCVQMCQTRKYVSCTTE